MIGDKLVFEDHHRDKEFEIMNKIFELKKSRMVVTIGGYSGTGKSEISVLLQQILWESRFIRSKIINLDDYYTTNFQERDIIRLVEGIDTVGSQEMNWDKIDKIINSFKEGKRLYLQRIHRYLNSTEHVILDSKNIDVLIIEGLYALNTDSNYKVFLDATEEDTYEFRKKRNKENPDEVFRKKVLEKEREDILETKPLANTIIKYKES